MSLESEVKKLAEYVRMQTTYMRRICILLEETRAPNVTVPGSALAKLEASLVHMETTATYGEIKHLAQQLMMKDATKVPVILRNYVGIDDQVVTNMVKLKVCDYDDVREDFRRVLNKKEPKDE